MVEGEDVSQPEILLPTFFIAGAAKAGSSMLYQLLASVPEVTMTAGKEPDIFGLGLRYSDGLNAYNGLYSHSTGEPVRGEASVSYMIYPETPRRIYDVVPSARIVFTLRNPILRFISHYWHRLRNGKEDRAFEQVVSRAKQDREHIYNNLSQMTNQAVAELDRTAYGINHSLYALSLQRYREVFPEDQIHVLILERFNRSYHAEMRSLLQFLGAAPNHIPEQGSVPVNKAWMIRSDNLKNILTSVVKLRPGRVLPAWLRKGGIKTYRWMRNANRGIFNAPELTTEQEDLLREVLADDVASLRALLDDRIPEWLETRYSI